MLILKVRQMQFQEIMIDSPSRSSRPASAPLRCSKATFDRCLLYNLNFLFSISSSPKYENKKKGPVTCSHGHMILCSTPQSPCYILGLPERINDNNGYSGHWYIRQTRQNHLLIRSFIILHFSGKSNVSFLSRNNSHIHSEYIDFIWLTGSEQFPTNIKVAMITPVRVSWKFTAGSVSWSDIL